MCYGVVKVFKDKWFFKFIMNRVGIYICVKRKREELNIILVVKRKGLNFFFFCVYKIFIERKGIYCLGNEKCLLVS